MTTWAVIATGASLKPAPELVARKVKHLPTVAVSDAFRIAPWARALVSTDANWWRKTPDALEFSGERWCATAIAGVRQIKHSKLISTSTNSGLIGLDFAVRAGAKRILLLGIDMCGTHYFGRHQQFKNTEPHRFALFMWQFQAYAAQMPKGIDVLNCSPISHLEVFPKVSLDEALEMEMAA